MLAEQAFVITADILRAKRIDVMPLKGIVLQRVLYQDAAQRPMVDVDVLVRSKDRDRATELLLKAGFAAMPMSRGGNEVALRAPNGFVVDLHWSLFRPGFFNLGTEDLFRRSSVDDSWFGFFVHRMSDLDVYAHLLGKIVSDHCTPRSRPRSFQELSGWASARQLTASEVVAHVGKVGMERAALHVWRLQQKLGDGLAEQARRLLPVRGVDQLLSLPASYAIERCRPHTAVSALSAHMLNTDFSSSVKTITHALMERFSTRFSRSIRP